MYNGPVRYKLGCRAKKVTGGNGETFSSINVKYSVDLRPLNKNEFQQEANVQENYARQSFALLSRHGCVRQIHKISVQNLAQSTF